MVRRRALVVLLVMLSTVVLSAARCTFGSSSNPTTSVDELARGLSGSGDDVALWERQLLQANGGSSTVDDAIASQLLDRTAAIDAVWDASKEAADLACLVWSSGGETIFIDGFPTFPEAEAQALLDRMHADADEDPVMAQSVSFACNLYDVANSGL